MITFIIGGSRSGKSRFALEQSSMYAGKKMYIATAQALDSEMKERIEKHKKERPDDWLTFEEPVRIADLIRGFSATNSIVVLDCLTLWLSNLMNKNSTLENGEKNIEDIIKGFIEAIKKYGEKEDKDISFSCSIYIVSNEVGFGIVPDNDISRRFRDLAGYLNQKVAEVADRVYFMMSGIPMKIK